MRTFADGCRAGSNPTMLERTVEPVPWNFPPPAKLLAAFF
jgi:hypothetical protein